MKQLELRSNARKEVFDEVEKYLTGLNLKIVSSDFVRPWGGFFVIDEMQAKQFADLFFPGVDLSSLRISGKLSPKILIVEPGKRLSWQYHHRRAEIWRVLFGTVGVVTSLTDEEGDMNTFKPGQEIRLTNEGIFYKKRSGPIFRIFWYIERHVKSCNTVYGNAIRSWHLNISAFAVKIGRAHV